MQPLKNLQSYIQEFNKNNKIEFEIDTIRVTFSKQHKIEDLKSIGKWNKIDKNNNKIKNKLKRRLEDDEVTTAYQLENYSIYFYNKKDPSKKYRKAEMVIFGLKQYHKEAPPHQIVERIVNLLTFGKSKNDTNIDVCFDMRAKPNIERLKDSFDIRQYISKDGDFGETYYINNTLIDMIERITIYNKAYKNKLQGTLWRIEAKIHIPNIKALYLPLNDLKHIIDISRN